MRARRLLAVVLLALPVSGAAQNAERIRATPQGSWARRGQEVAAARRIAAEAPTQAAIEGVMRHALVPVAFSDESLQFSASSLRERLYGPGDGDHASLSSYFDEASLGHFGIEGEALFEITLPQSSADYVGQRRAERFNGVADGLDVFLRAVLDELRGQVDWRAFVGPGETRVPALVLVTAGPGGNCSGDTDHVWPHRWHLTGLLGQPYRTASLNANGDTILIDDYIVQPSEECDGTMAEVGVIAHETGHLLGLPDLYNTADFGVTSPVGDWGLMATGNYNRPSSPALPGAWTRTFTGWGTVIAPTPEEYTDRTVVHLPPVQSTGQILRLSLPDDDEYFLLENRRALGSDEHLHGEGLVVWYVNEGIIGANLDDNTVNADLSRPGVSVLAADGRRDMETNVNNGDGGDVWPGATGKTRLDDTSVPALASLVSGEPVRWKIAEMAVNWGRPDGGVQFTLRADEAPTDSLDVLTVLPASFPPVLPGVDLDVVLSVEGLPNDSITWAVDSAAVASIGLSFDPEEARLTGQIPDSADGSSLAVRAETADGRYGVRVYEIQIGDTPDLRTEQVIRAILEAGDPLPAEQAALLDAYGNRNGRVDLGDLVRAFRLGLLDPADLRSLPAIP